MKVYRETNKQAQLKSPRIAIRGFLSALCLVWAVGSSGGCGASRRPVVRLEPQVERPESAVLLISIDGLAVKVFDELLDTGDLPNIKSLIDRGLRVRRAVASEPTITYAMFTTILTGRYAGSHGIVGNKWFDRWALLYRDYTNIVTYRWVGKDYLAPTLYERLPATMKSVSIQSPNRRGAARKIDNWASSGIRWFFGALHDVDRLIPLRMELIAESANRWGVWPVLIHAYLPAVDEIGHRYGADSTEYRRAVINADRQVGRLFQAVQDAGMIDRTCFVLISDHGHLPSPPDRYFNVADHLRRMGWTVQDRPTHVADYNRRRRHYAGTDAVVVTGGDRRAVIHLPGPDAWHQRPDYAVVEALIDPAAGPGPSVWLSPAVKFAFAPRRDPATGRRTVEVYSRHGHSRMGRRRVRGRLEYGYQVVTTDALAGAIPTGWYDAQTWLTLTVDTPYPDFVVPLVELFESPRAGDVMLTAAPGWDFSAGGRGGHGGVDAGDVLIPMVFAGPGIPAGCTIDHARLVDLAPTILGLISAEDRAFDVESFDGIDRSGELRQGGNDE